MSDETKIPVRGSIEMRSYDLMIKTLENGNDVVQIKGSVAFDPGFIEHCLASGVQRYIERDERDEHGDSV